MWYSFKSYWLCRAYRLKSRRALKNLMMITAGCDQRSAGIGNIAYVKDLMTERVVTTKLRCSKFGFAHHRFTKFGWVRRLLIFCSISKLNLNYLGRGNLMVPHSIKKQKLNFLKTLKRYHPQWFVQLGKVGFTACEDDIKIHKNLAITWTISRSHRKIIWYLRRANEVK